MCLDYVQRKETAVTRQGRASEAQIDVMVNYFCLHPHVANNKLKGMQGKKELQGSWEELTDTLNAMFKNGKKKSVDSWKTTWRDTKTKISNKVTSSKKNRAATGNKPNDIVLTERDKKVIGLIGYDYIEGLATVPDPFPEELENIYERLEQGDTTVEEAIPQVVTMRPIAMTVPAEENIDDELLPTDSITLTLDANIEENTEIIIDPILNPAIPNPLTFNNPSAENIALEKEIAEVVPKNKTQHTSGLVKQSRMPITSRAKFLRQGVHHERLGVQLKEARRVFTSLAERTCEATEVLAQAEQMRAEAALIQAENNRVRTDILRTIAENDKARNEVLLRLVDTLDSILRR